MQEQLRDAWLQFQESVLAVPGVPILTLCLHLLLGGLLALVVRFVYRHASASTRDTDSITRIFPLLTMVTIAVIAVVKSSMALSLGLVGALSIVRFRSSIKEPEELVYLFLCIAIGLSLGAQQVMLAVALVIVSTAFSMSVWLFGRGRRQQNLLLTITGDSHEHFNDDESGVLLVLEKLVGRYSLQRFDVENGRGQIRVALSRTSPRETCALIARLRERLPDCEFSYVNMNSVL
jgi:hypothetical protein